MSCAANHTLPLLKVVSVFRHQLLVLSSAYLGDSLTVDILSYGVAPESNFLPSSQKRLQGRVDEHQPHFHREALNGFQTSAG